MTPPLVFTMQEAFEQRGQVLALCGQRRRLALSLPARCR